MVHIWCIFCFAYSVFEHFNFMNLSTFAKFVEFKYLEKINYTVILLQTIAILYIYIKVVKTTNPTATLISIMNYLVH